MSFWVVGITETCERLAICGTQKRAERFCGELPNVEQGIYYIDGPCHDTIVLAGVPVDEMPEEDDFADQEDDT